MGRDSNNCPSTAFGMDPNALHKSSRAIAKSLPHASVASSIAICKSCECS